MMKTGFTVGRKQYEKALGSPVELGLLVEGVDYLMEKEGGVERLLFSEEALLKVRRESLNKILGIKGSVDCGKEPEVVEDKVEVVKARKRFPNQSFIETDNGIMRTGKFAGRLKPGMLLRVKNNIVVGVA